MRHLIASELKKVLSSKLILILFAVLLAVNCYMSFAAVSQYHNFDKCTSNAYSHIIDDPEGTAEYFSKLDTLMQNNLRDLAFGRVTKEEIGIPYTYCSDGSCDDHRLLELAYERYDYIKTHQKAIYKISMSAKARIDDLTFFGYDDNSYEVRYQNLVAERYDALLDIIPPDSEYAYGYNKYLEQTTPVVLIVVMITVITSYIFLCDRYNGFSTILRTTSGGWEKTILAKIIVALILCFVVTIIYLASSFAVIGLTYGYSSPFIPIQCFSGYYAVPYEITILGYILLNTLLKLIGLCVYTLLIAASAYVFGSYIGCFGTGAVFAVINVILYQNDYSGTAPVSKYINYCAMTAGNELTMFYRCINVFGYPMSYVTALLLLSLLFAGVFVWMCVMFSRKYTYTKYNSILAKYLQIRAGTRDKKKQRVPSTSLWRYEMSKIRFGILAVLIVLLLFGKTVYLQKTVDSMEKYTEAVYYQYISHIQELSDTARKTYMLIERSRINTIIDQYGTQTEKFQKGEITRQEYSEYTNKFSEAQTKDDVFSRVESYVKYLDRKNVELSGDEVPIYTSGYEKLFTDSADWFAFVVLTILCINSFTVEYTKNSSCEGCASIIRATKKGRRHTFLAKTVTLGLIGSITTVLFRIVDTVVISEKYILTNTDAALYTIQSFGGITSMITIEQYFLIDLLIRLIGGMALAVLICVFSYLGKRILPALCLITVIMLIPEIIVLTVFNTLPEISLLSLTCLQRLPFSYSAGGYFADINTAYLWVGIVIVLILSVTLLAYRNYVGKRAFRKE